MLYEYGFNKLSRTTYWFNTHNVYTRFAKRTTSQRKRRKNMRR